MMHSIKRFRQCLLLLASLGLSFSTSAAPAQEFLKRELAAGVLRSMWETADSHPLQLPPFNTEMRLRKILSALRIEKEVTWYQQAAANLQDREKTQFKKVFFELALEDLDQTPVLENGVSAAYFSHVLAMATLTGVRILEQHLPTMVSEIFPGQAIDPAIHEPLRQLIEAEWITHVSTIAQDELVPNATGAWIMDAIQFNNEQLTPMIDARLKRQSKEAWDWLKIHRPMRKEPEGIPVKIIGNEEFAAIFGSTEPGFSEAFFSSRDRVIYANMLPILTDFEGSQFFYTAVHEIQHARQLVNFALTPDANPDREWTPLIKHMLEEGEATFVATMFEYERERPVGLSLHEFVEARFHVYADALEEWQPHSAEYYDRQMYPVGLHFAHVVWRHRGWAGIDDAFRDFPNMRKQDFDPEHWLKTPPGKQ